MAYEYKCVGAPERSKRQKGAKTRTDRVAMAMQQLIAEHATGGWEYLRTDLVPVEERGSIFSRSQEVHRAVLVFRREILRLSGQQRGGGVAGTRAPAGPASVQPSLSAASAEPPLSADQAAAPRGGRTLTGQG